MDVSKSPSPKKRKSLGNPKNTPAKKINVEVVTPKTPKNSQNQNSNESVVKSAKKKKLETKNQNSKSSPEKQAIEKVVKQPKKKNAGDEKDKTNELPKFPGTKVLDSTDSKPKDKIKKRSKRKPTSEVRAGLVNVLMKRAKEEGKDVVVKSLNEKIDEILSRPTVTKSAKKKTKYYKYLIGLVTGEKKPPTEKSSNNAPKKAQEKKKDKKNENKVEKKVKTQVQKEESDDDEEEDEEQSAESGDSEDAENMEEEESDSDNDEEAEDSEDEDEDEENDDEEEETDSEVEAPSKVTIKKEKVNGTDTLKQKSPTDKKSRYVLFVGNLAYDATKDEIKKHFNSVGEVVDVRIPTDKDTNRPRGFAYVELANEASYQKAMDMNGSQLKNRKIKVEYTQGGKKNSENKKKEIKAKNFKLQAMRQQGKFGEGKPKNGNKFQKRPNEGKKFQKKK